MGGKNQFKQCYSYLFELPQKLKKETDLKIQTTRNQTNKNEKNEKTQAR